MKYLSLLVFVSFITVGFTQITFNTGSGELDANLTSINERGKGDFISFKKELSVDFSVPAPKLENMRVKIGLEPGEIYLALEIARNSPSTLDDVIRIYQENKDKGWGYIAKQAGIKPGSAAFHQLKNNSKGRKDKGGKPDHAKAKSDKKGNNSKGKGNSKKGK